MLIAALNFASHFVAWRQKSLRPYRADPEAKLVVLVALASCVGVALYLWAHNVYPDFGTALRHAAFNVISIATTTGYSNTDYSLWPLLAPLWMLFLCCLLSSSGSTGSGIKMVRAELLFRQGLREMVKLIHPTAQVPVKLAGQTIANQVIFAVLAFMSLYGASIVAMTFLLLASGLDFVTAFSAIIASINNTGPGLGRVGPASTYAVLNDFQTWVCTFAMLLGRLELFTLLVIFTPTFWRK
jgi:trk system potassium uptake protein TrkH